MVGVAPKVAAVVSNERLLLKDVEEVIVSAADKSEMMPRSSSSVHVRGR